MATKHISKSKVLKNEGLGPLFGRSDVVLRGRRKGLCTLSKVSKTSGFCGSFNCNYNYNDNTLHYPRRTLHYYTTPHYITLHNTPLRLQQDTLHYTPLHYTPLHYTTLHHTTLHYPTLHDARLHYTHNYNYSYKHNNNNNNNNNNNIQQLQLKYSYTTFHYTMLH